MDRIQVSFDEQQVISGEPYKGRISSQLNINWTYQDDQYYALLVYHRKHGLDEADYIVVDIPGNDIQRGRVIIPYGDQSIHLGEIYYIEVWKEKQRPDNMSINPFPYPIDEYRKRDDIFEPYVKFELNLTTNHFLGFRDHAHPRYDYYRYYEGRDRGYHREENGYCHGNEQVNYHRNREFNYDHRNGDFNCPRCQCRSRDYQPPLTRTPFISSSSLTSPEKKYCSCVMDVAMKQEETCLKNREKWGSRGCYNPYAVCARSVGTTTRECGSSYDFQQFDDKKLRAYAVLNDIDIPEPYSHEKMLENIKKWKFMKSS